MNKKFFIAWLVIFIVWMAGDFLVHRSRAAGSAPRLSDLLRGDAANGGDGGQADYLQRHLVNRARNHRCVVVSRHRDDLIAGDWAYLTLKHGCVGPQYGWMREKRRSKWWFHLQDARQSRRRISAQPEGKDRLRAHCVVAASLIGFSQRRSRRLALHPQSVFRARVLG
jgi:hypothetical protein